MPGLVVWIHDIETVNPDNRARYFSLSYALCSLYRLRGLRQINFNSSNALAMPSSCTEGQMRSQSFFKFSEPLAMQ